MATYVSLFRWTDQGVRNAKDTMQRHSAFRADLERRGCKLVSIFWTQGEYDLVTTIEAPDAQTAMAALIAVAGLGNVRTETLLAFSEREMTSILEKV
jgi:uncharacterized protein with GYD domain